MTTGPSASLGHQDEAKRGGPHLEPQAPPNGGGEAPTTRSGFFTMNAFERHEATLRRAWQACKTRGFWSPFPDVPGKYPDADAARIAGRQAYAAHLGQDFEIVYAVFHTTGQSFNMSYAGSGVNALDRGIEALAYARDAMAAVPRHARWSRDFGSATITLDKTYRLVPCGVTVCFTCASFPTWNAYPAMILAAIQSDETLRALQWLLDEGRRSGRVLLEPRSYAHPEFPQARTSTPLMLQIGKDRRDLYGEERFGPVSFVIGVEDAEDALAQACADVRADAVVQAFGNLDADGWCADVLVNTAGLGIQRSYLRGL